MRAPHRLQDVASRELSCRALVLSLHPESGEFRAFVGGHADRIDWRWVLERAHAHKVIALVAARIEECGLARNLDVDLAGQFRQAREEARSRAAIALRTLERVAHAFEIAGVPFFVIKGSVLAEQVYGDASLRRFADVDVVTRRESLPQAETVLRSLGYHFGQIEELLAASPDGPVEWRAAEAVTRRFYERFQYELPFYEPRGGELLAVDLHWHVAPAFRLQVDASQLWEQTVPVTVGGIGVATFNAAATLIHLALHASTCTLGAFRLLHFCDVVWTAIRWKESPEPLWRLAETWRVTTPLREVLQTVEQVFDLPLPLLTHEQRQITSSPLRRQLTAEFLVEAGRDCEWSRPRRLCGELIWNGAMGCLQENMLRSIRTRAARLQWIAWRWRNRRRTAT